MGVGEIAGVLLAMVFVYALPLYVVYRTIAVATRLRNQHQAAQYETLELLKEIRLELQALRTQLTEQQQAH